jgi:hypothetical protein
VYRGGSSLSTSLVGAGLLQCDQLALEVGLQMGVMVALEGSQLFDLFLQHSSFAVELLKYLGLLLLGLDDRGLCLGDECVVLGFASRYELVVLGLSGRQQLFLPRGGFDNNLVVARRSRRFSPCGSEGDTAGSSPAFGS